MVSARLLLIGCSLFWVACAPAAPLPAEMDAAVAPDAPPPPPPSWLDESRGELPPRMSELGLFPEAPRLDAVHPRAVAFEPAFVLWSNGAAKLRHLVLPEGARIDASDPEGWRFPTGTLLFKTFTFERDGAPRPIETRVLVRAMDGWDYAAYRWDEDGRDAVRLDLRAETVVDVELEDGSLLAHEIPAGLECAQCHESALGSGADRAVLGLRPEMLGASLDALAPLVEGAIAPVDPLAALSPEHRWVAGYALGNCVHCHNGGAGDSASFDMRPEVMLESLVGVRTTEASSPPGLRVAAGDPERSVLFQMLTRDSPDPDVQPMPPVGVQRADAEAVAEFERWIAALPVE